MSPNEAAFWKFHWTNPWVYKLVSKYALKAVAAGHESYGIGALWEDMRWEINVYVASNDGFKLNNNHRAFYARLWMSENPDYAGFLKTREQREPMELTHDILRDPASY